MCCLSTLCDSGLLVVSFKTTRLLREGPQELCKILKGNTFHKRTSNNGKGFSIRSRELKPSARSLSYFWEEQQMMRLDLPCIADLNLEE